MVRIRRKPQTEGKKPNYFNLKLSGFLPERPVKNFWHLHVQREGSNLVIEDGERIAYLGEKKPKKGKPTKVNERAVMVQSTNQSKLRLHPKNRPSSRKSRVVTAD